MVSLRLEDQWFRLGACDSAFLHPRILLYIARLLKQKIKRYFNTEDFLNYNKNVFFLKIFYIYLTEKSIYYT